MKKTAIIAFLIMSQIVCAQVYTETGALMKETPGGIVMVVEDKNDIDKIYKMYEVDVKSDFPNGINAFYDFCDKNFVNPNEVKLKGKIYLSFIIERDGSLTAVKCLGDIGYSTGLEAIRVLKLSPKWIPSELNGKKVRSLYFLTIPID